MLPISAILGPKSSYGKRHERDTSGRYRDGHPDSGHRHRYRPTRPLRAALKTAADLACNEKGPLTRKAYASDFHIFERWCAEHGLAALPAGSLRVNVVDHELTQWAPVLDWGDKKPIFKTWLLPRCPRISNLVSSREQTGDVTTR